MRSLLTVCVAVVVASCLSLQVSAGVFFEVSGNDAHTDASSRKTDTTLYSMTAIASREGVLVQWRSNFEIDNIGFNVYRLRNGQRAKVNREIIAGSAFIAGENKPLRAGYSYSCFDLAGTADSIYSIESLALDGTTKTSSALVPSLKQKLPSFEQSLELDRLGAATSSGAGPVAAQRQFITEDSQAESAAGVSTAGAIEDQWAVAAQSALKISINRDGWYRVTQQQGAGVGFGPAADIRNLKLFTSGRELAISTSKGGGQFAAGDYFEFYGQGLDLPTTDIRTYYLIVSTSPGLRIKSDLRIDNISEPARSSQSLLFPVFDLGPQPVSLWIYRVLNDLPPMPLEHTSGKKAEALLRQPAEPIPATSSEPAVELPTTAEAPSSNTVPAQPAREKPSVHLGPGALDSVAQTTTLSSAKRRKEKKNRGRKRKYSHPSLDPATATPSFDYSVERKDRLIYFSSLLNGETENFFGSVISSSPVTLTLNIANIETTASGPAKVEIAMQGANVLSHDIDIKFNDVAIGTLSYFGLDHAVQTLAIPVSLLQNGNNSISFLPRSGSGLSLVDYVRLTYPHSYRADSDSLKLPLRFSQSANVDGFSGPDLKLVDYTDPFSVRVSRPVAEAKGVGYSVQVPTTTVRSKSRRQLYLLPASSFDQPAGLALNQPSGLNQSDNGADLLIITHGSLIPSVAPLVNLRRAQALSVFVVDVEDVYDEFSYGVHGPQAIRDFLARATAVWTKVPRYLLFVGDASLDPRNYLGAGNFDLVPTKLIDTAANETSSDEWFSDFNNNGIGEIPVGRLPVRTATEANVVISKIVNFTPASVPQTALLVGDAQCLMRSFGLDCYFFSFKQANDQVQTLVSPKFTVLRVDRPTAPTEAQQGPVDAQVRADLLAQFNQGQALVNYSGHGNVDTWTGAAIFTADDAFAATNGNKLPFVVVMDCLNGYFQDPFLRGLAEQLLKAPNGGAVASFASSGLTTPDGQHEMSKQLYLTLYGSQPVALGDAIKIAKASTPDLDVRRTWILFGDPSMKIW